MISFIVIGRNEGWKLTKCLQSIIDTIEYNKLKDYEIIYVDSKSTDDSIERAKRVNGIKIFKIIGTYNAAIARNIGFKESNGDVLFFIDGDVEIIPDFLNNVLDRDYKLRYNCVAGYLDNIFYDTKGNFIKRSPQGYTDLSKTEITNRAVNGGIFLIKRDLWQLVNGMNTKYRKNQDIDLALRMAKRGIRFTRVPFLMGLHHTVDYGHQSRMWKSIMSGNLLYPAVTTRDHLFYFPKIKHTLRRQYTAIFLLLFTISIIFGQIFILFLSVYFLLLLTKVYMNSRNAATDKESKLLYFVKRTLYQIASDIIFWIGFIGFYPKKKKLSYNNIT